MNKFKVKCLFGHHTFDDKWKVGAVKNFISFQANRQQSIFIVCGNCRTVAQFMNGDDDLKPWTMKIILESVFYFVARSPNGIHYKFRKILSHKHKLEDGLIDGKS